MSLVGRILIVDDEANARSALGALLEETGCTVELAADGLDAVGKLDAFAPDVVLTDVKMPRMDGLGLMAAVHARDPDCPVIVMTAYGAVPSAVAAMRAGARDYLAKPIKFDQLVLVVERALEQRRLRLEAKHLRERLAAQSRMPGFVGASPQMQAVFDSVMQVAPTRATVLITGETGTGKGMIAAAIHAASSRAKGPFVKLHCAALAESLLESEIFGHEAGAFTGAAVRRDGRFEQANGGTLFLDEIGEVSPAVQVKLLRFLQSHEFERVGGSKTLSTDVRIIAATHRDLRDLIARGQFREDLFYRLNVVTIHLPPLRERVPDIGLLTQYFLEQYARENDTRVLRISEDALRLLQNYRWPGNVRELENVVRRAALLCRGEMIRPDDINGLVSVIDKGGKPAPDYPDIPGTTMAEIQRFAILKTLQHTGGSTSQAGEILHISPRKIQYKLREYQSGLPARPHGKRAKRLANQQTTAR